MKKSFFFTTPEPEPEPELEQEEVAEAETAQLAAADAVAPQLPPTTPFAEMHLKIGGKIPIESLAHPEMKERVLVTVIGWLEGGSFVVAIPQKASQRSWVKPNDRMLLRAFTGEKAFSFQAVVLRMEHFPFAYLHLSFPDKVETVTIRRSPRHEVYFPVKIAIEGAADMRGHILDIGMNGARVESLKPLVDIDSMRLIMQFELHGAPMLLELNSKVRSSKEVPNEQGKIHYEYGVEFQNLQPNDRLILGSLLWYEMQARTESE